MQHIRDLIHLPNGDGSQGMISSSNGNATSQLPSGWSTAPETESHSLAALAESKSNSLADAVAIGDARRVIEMWYDPMSDEAYSQFAAKIVRKGWTCRELSDAIDRFTDRPWPKWTLGDFFSYEPPRVYPYSWYLGRIAEWRGNADLIGVYAVGDNRVFGWRSVVGDRLPEVKALPVAVAEVKALPATTDEVTAPPPPEVSLVAQLIRLKVRAENAERDLDALQKENAALKIRISANEETLME